MRYFCPISVHASPLTETCQQNISKPFQSLIDTFSKKAKEFHTEDHVTWNIFVKADRVSDVIERLWHDKNLDLQMIDLDSLSTLDDYVRLFALENESTKLEADLTTQERIVMKILDESLALAAEIIGNRANELEQIDYEIEKRFRKQRSRLLNRRIVDIQGWKRTVFGRSRGLLEWR